MKIAAWFNGMLSTLGVIDIGFLLRYIWTHNEDGIFTLALIGFVIFVFWFSSVIKMAD